MVYNHIMWVLLVDSSGWTLPHQWLIRLIHNDDRPPFHGACTDAGNMFASHPIHVEWRGPPGPHLPSPPGPEAIPDTCRRRWLQMQPHFPYLTLTTHILSKSFLHSETVASWAQRENSIKLHKSSVLQQTVWTHQGLVCRISCSTLIQLIMSHTVTTVAFSLAH